MDNVVRLDQRQRERREKAEREAREFLTTVANNAPSGPLGTLLVAVAQARVQFETATTQDRVEPDEGWRWSPVVKAAERLSRSYVDGGEAS